MRKFEFEKNGYHFARIDKKTARRAYNNDLTILFCPINLNPANTWNVYACMNKKEQNTRFDTLTSQFEAYNCTGSETGYYAAFYIPVKWVDRFSGEPTYNNDINAVMQYDYNF